MSKFLDWDKDIDHVQSILQRIQQQVEQEEKQKSYSSLSLNLRGGGDGPNSHDRTTNFALSAQLSVFHDKLLQARIKIKALQEVLDAFNGRERNGDSCKLNFMTETPIHDEPESISLKSPFLPTLYQLEKIRTPSPALRNDSVGGQDGNSKFFSQDYIDRLQSSQALTYPIRRDSCPDLKLQSSLEKLSMSKSKVDDKGLRTNTVSSSGLFPAQRQPFEDLGNIQNPKPQALLDMKPLSMPEASRATIPLKPPSLVPANLGLNEKLMECLQDIQFGINAPVFSLLQIKALPPCAAGRDVIISAPESPDRILTYCLHLLNRVDDSMFGLQAFVITPSRHLGDEVRRALMKLGKFHKNLLICHAKGGKYFKKDSCSLRQGAQILIGDPECVLTLLKKARVLPDQNSIVIIDQAESVLSLASAAMKASIYGIIKHLSSKIQVIVSGSEFSTEILGLTKKFMRNPAFVSWIPEECNGLEPSVKTSRHFFINTRIEPKKLSVFIELCNLFVKSRNKQMIVFCNDPRGVQRLASSLGRNGFLADYAEGTMTRADRSAIMEKFKKHEFEILVMTDFLCRGIDIQNYEIVCNYDLPPANNYLHRIGDGGLVPRKGITINFTTDKYLYYIQKIEQFSDITIEQVDHPRFFDKFFS